MTPILLSILSALIPVGVEGVKQALNTWTGGPKPTTIDEQIKLESAEVAKLEALAKLDNPYGTPRQWVIDLRASARYLAAFAVIIGGVGVCFVKDAPVEIRAVGLEAASTAFGFLFGTRITVGMSRK
jgi:hypothetical protein